MSKKPVWAVAFALRQAGVPFGDELAWMLRERHVHSYTPTVTAPTCMEAGFTTYECACGDSYVGDPVAALGHSAGETVEENRVEATEEAAGSYDSVVYCTRCGTELSRETTVLPQLILNGYLYNGVHLPDIRALLAAYPYAIWTMDGAGACVLWLTPEPICCYPTVISSGKDIQYFINTGTDTMTYQKYWGVSDGSTFFHSEYSLTYTKDAGGALSISSYSVSPPLIFWANYDVYEAVKTDGVYEATDTIFFPKSSDPVPVYQ